MAAVATKPSMAMSNALHRRHHYEIPLLALETVDVSDGHCKQQRAAAQLASWQAESPSAPKAPRKMSPTRMSRHRPTRQGRQATC